MDCLYLQNLLSAFLDDELAPEEKQLIRRHLFSCEYCQQELETLKLTKLILSSMKSVEVPIDFVAAVKYSLGRETVTPFFFRDLRWLAVAAITFVFWIVPSFINVQYDEQFTAPSNNEGIASTGQETDYTPYNLNVPIPVSEEDPQREPVRIDAVLVRSIP